MRPIAIALALGLLGFAGGLLTLSRSPDMRPSMAHATAATERFDFEPRAMRDWRTVSGRWVVEDMTGAPSGKRVLVQRAVDDPFNVIVAPAGPYTDVDVSVDFKPISGREDASGGIVFLLPSFVLMLSVLPALERVRHLTWTKAALKGVGPAVIGMTAAAIVQMVPKAVSDPFTAVVALLTVLALLVRRLGPLPLMAGGGAIGFILRAR